MFWRRRKLPEDEPLVPHGLISQAMDSEGSPGLPPDMLDSPKDVEPSPAEPVEMRLRVSAPAQNRVQETAPLPEQGKISPPLRWPRVDEAEIARRAQEMETAVSFPYRKPVMGAAVPHTDEFESEPETAEPTRLELVESPPATEPIPAVSILAARSEKFSNLLSRVRSLRLPTFEPLRQKIRSAFSQARTSASTGFQSARNGMQEVRSKSGVALDAAKRRLVDKSQAAIAQSRSGLQHVRENIRGKDWSGASRIWNRVRSWQVTVRIPASDRPFISSALQSAKSSGLLVRQMIQRDSRLWASMGMAALSALLALGFISGIRHYGPDRVEAQPTSTQAVPTAAPMKAAQSNSVVLSKPSTAAKAIDSKPSPIAKTPVTKQAARQTVTVVSQKKEVAAVNPPKHRVRHISEEDDYVAKDTYVFYGSSGKR